VGAALATICVDFSAVAEATILVAIDAETLSFAFATQIAAKKAQAKMNLLNRFTSNLITGDTNCGSV
jgi:ethanolamine utilization microcompartment shell protein EutS